MGLLTVTIIYASKVPLEKLLMRWRLSPVSINTIIRSAPMYAAIVAVLIVYLGDFAGQQQLPIVGEIPNTLPTMQTLNLTWADFQTLTLPDLLIAMVVFMESSSIATAMASKRREKIEPNQELFSLGTANIGASLFGGFPVAGSFARTVMNDSSGATT